MILYIKEVKNEGILDIISIPDLLNPYLFRETKIYNLVPSGRNRGIEQYYIWL